MATINLRDLYPEEELDCIIEVQNGDAEAFKATLTKEIADVYFEEQRRENAYQRRLFRNKAHYSLDCDDGIENDAINSSADLFEEYAAKLSKQQLHNALNSLPEKQRKRIYAQYFCGMNRSEIARAEGVDVSSVRESINAGLIKLKNILQKFL